MCFYIASVFQSFKLNSEFSKSQGRKEKMEFYVTHTAGAYCAPVFSSLSFYFPITLDHHARIMTITYLFLPCGPEGSRLCLSLLVRLRVADMGGHLRVNPDYFCIICEQSQPKPATSCKIPLDTWKLD